MATVSPLHNPNIPIFAQYTLTASAAALSGIIGYTQTPARLTIKNSDGAANAVFLGGATVANTPANAGIQLGPGQAWTFLDQSPARIFIVGTVNAANIAFIVAEY